MCKKIGKCKEYAFLKFPGHVYSEKVLFNDAEFESKPLILRRSEKKSTKIFKYYRWTWTTTGTPVSITKATATVTTKFATITESLATTATQTSLSTLK